MPLSRKSGTLIGVYPGNGEGGKGVGAGCERSEQRCERSEQQLVTPVTNQARALLLHEGGAESAREWLGLRIEVKRFVRTSSFLVGSYSRPRLRIFQSGQRAPAEPELISLLLVKAKRSPSASRLINRPGCFRAWAY